MDAFWTPLFCFTILPMVAHATIICGDFVCHGLHPYCCELDSGDAGCCWDTYIYQLWWFWFIWVVIFFLIVGCSAAIWRRRRRTVRYTVMANSTYPAYGTVVHTGYAQNAPPPPPASAPVLPPTYAAAEASKPPPYSG